MWTQLKPTYTMLAKDSRWKVRRTLSFSLHEIARIIGPELAEKDLIPVLFQFLQDIPEVKEGVVTNMPKFIEILTPVQREVYIEKLAQNQQQES